MIDQQVASAPSLSVQLSVVGSPASAPSRNKEVSRPAVAAPASLDVDDPLDVPELLAASEPELWHPATTRIPTAAGTTVNRGDRTRKRGSRVMR